MRTMWKNTGLSLLVTLAMVCGTSARAQSAMQQKIAARFAAADVNHDGKLSKAEAQAGMPRVASHFDEIDTAHTGSITLEQIEQFAMQKKQ